MWPSAAKGSFCDPSEGSWSHGFHGENLGNSPSPHGIYMYMTIQNSKSWEASFSVLFRPNYISLNEEWGTSRKSNQRPIENAWLFSLNTNAQSKGLKLKNILTGNTRGKQSSRPLSKFIHLIIAVFSFSKLKSTERSSFVTSWRDSHTWLWPWPYHVTFGAAICNHHCRAAVPQWLDASIFCVSTLFELQVSAFASF